MPVQLDPTIVGARDKRPSSTFRTDILGLTPPTTCGPFAVVQFDNDVQLGAPVPNPVGEESVLLRAGGTADVLLDVSNPAPGIAHCRIAGDTGSGTMFGSAVARRPEPVR
jgi:hypothetical protein